VGAAGYTTAGAVSRRFRRSAIVTMNCTANSRDIFINQGTWYLVPTVISEPVRDIIMATEMHIGEVKRILRPLHSGRRNCHELT